jgi:hypothetical protein
VLAQTKVHIASSSMQVEFAPIGLPNWFQQTNMSQHSYHTHTQHVCVTQPSQCQSIWNTESGPAAGPPDYSHRHCQWQAPRLKASNLLTASSC